MILDLRFGLDILGWFCIETDALQLAKIRGFFGCVIFVFDSAIIRGDDDRVRKLQVFWHHAVKFLIDQILTLKI